MEQKTGRPLAAMRKHQAPNLVILSRASDPPIARLRRDDEIAAGKEKAPVDPDAPTKGNKSELRGMSSRSAVNVARVLSSLDWAKNGECLHVTATYWKQWPRSKGDLADEKAAIVRDIGRHVEAGIWRLEFQRRETDQEKREREEAGRPRRKGQGSLYVPHWHFLLWLGGRQLEHVGTWLHRSTPCTSVPATRHAAPGISPCTRPSVGNRRRSRLEDGGATSTAKNFSVHRTCTKPAKFPSGSACGGHGYIVGRRAAKPATSKACPGSCRANTNAPLINGSASTSTTKTRSAGRVSRLFEFLSEYYRNGYVWGNVSAPNSPKQLSP
jgi:hypothetical protein